LKKNQTFFESGIIWPYAIVLALLGVAGMGAWTINKAIENPVEESQIYMRYYQNTMNNVNDIIKAKIAFDKKYNLTFVTDQIHKGDTTIQYKITDKSGKSVDNADITVRVTTPYSHDDDINIENFKVKDGLYTFETIKIPKEGRWNIMAKVSIGDNSRYLNLKADTRYPNTQEY